MQKYKLARRERTVDPCYNYPCCCPFKGCYCNHSAGQCFESCAGCAKGEHVTRKGKRFAVRY